jgi:hypothetical protein
MITTKILKDAIQLELNANKSLNPAYETIVTVKKSKGATKIKIVNDYRIVNATITQLDNPEEVLIEMTFGYAGRAQGIYNTSDIKTIAWLIADKI